MHRLQKNYVLAKAHYEAMKEIEEKYVGKFFSEREIVNQDGTRPKSFNDLDIELFDDVYTDFEKTDYCIDDEVLRALHAKIRAEDELIDFAIEISPAGIRDFLWEAAKVCSMRQELLELAVNLDTSTIRPAAAGER